MSTCLVVVTDGRFDYLARTLESATQNLPTFNHRVVIDDTEHRLGFAGAVQAGFDAALKTRADYIFWLEADFTFRCPIPVDDMLAALDAHPHLVQMALLRQPVNDREKAAGGIVQMDPELYAAREWKGHRWLEHRRCVTTNPSVWPRWVLERGWPQRPQSEGHFGIDLFASDARLRAGYWGDGSEYVEHIGSVRTGRGY